MRFCLAFVMAVCLLAVVSAKPAVEIRKSDAGFWYVVKGGNGEITFKGQMYTKLDDARDGVVAFLKSGSDKDKYSVSQSDKDKQFYINLKAPNNKILASGEGYKAKDGAENGITSNKNTADTLIEELANTIIKTKELKGVKGNRIKVETSKDKKPYFNMIAENNEIILTSETYSSDQACAKGVASVLKNGGTATGFEIKNSKDGQEYFILKGLNEKTIGVSETYHRKAGAKGGEAAVKDAVHDILKAGIAAKLDAVADSGKPSDKPAAAAADGAAAPKKPTKGQQALKPGF